MSKLIPIYTIYQAHEALNGEPATGGDGFALGHKSCINSWTTPQAARNALQTQIRNRINQKEITVLEQKWNEDGIHGSVIYWLCGVKYISWVVQEFLVTEEDA